MENVTPDETGYIPTPYELGGQGELVHLFLNSGFESATEDRITKILHVRDYEDYFELFLKALLLGTLSAKRRRVSRRKFSERQN